MFYLRRPSDDDLRRKLERLRSAEFTHADVGLTEQELTRAPDGFVLDRYSTELGVGDDVFTRGRRVLETVGNYPPSFTRVIRVDHTLEPGMVFGTLAKHLGFWSLHPCRVIYVVDDAVAESVRFGFGFGTLPGHAEIGEERFLIRRALSTNVVTYEVQAFSRPGQLVTKLGAPVTRAYQKRFQRETVGHMRRVCG